MKFAPGDKVVKLNGMRTGKPKMDKGLRAGTHVGTVVRVRESGTVMVDWGWPNEPAKQTSPSVLMKVDDTPSL